MTDYTELVKALRYCISTPNGVINCKGCPYFGSGIDCQNDIHADAAAAIEALQAQLPKRGKWLPYEFNANGIWHTCSVCGVAYQYKDAPNSGWWINHKYCPNCGAKMEVQDADK